MLQSIIACDMSLLIRGSSCATSIYERLSNPKMIEKDKLWVLELILDVHG